MRLSCCGGTRPTWRTRRTRQRESPQEGDGLLPRLHTGWPVAPRRRSRRFAQDLFSEWVSPGRARARLAADRRALRGSARPARRLLRREVDAVRSPAGGARHALSAGSVVCADDDSLRQDRVLSRARTASRQTARIPGGRRGQRPQPYSDRHPVPPGHRRGRVAHGFRGRVGDQAPVAGAGMPKRAAPGRTARTDLSRTFANKLKIEEVSMADAPRAPEIRGKTIRFTWTDG